MACFPFFPDGPAIQIGYVYGGEPLKIKIGDTGSARQSPAGFVQFIQPFQVIRIFTGEAPSRDWRFRHLRWKISGVLDAFLHRDRNGCRWEPPCPRCQKQKARQGTVASLATGAVFGSPAFSDLKARMFTDARMCRRWKRMERRDGKTARWDASGEFSIQPPWYR